MASDLCSTAFVWDLWACLSMDHHNSGRSEDKVSKGSNPLSHIRTIVKFDGQGISFEKGMHYRKQDFQDSRIFSKQTKLV